MKYRELYRQAVEMIPLAYAPFSKFKVGAALLGKDGKVYTGVNVENSSFGGTICAERTAFVKAISEGCTEFEAIAVVSSDGEAWPCGICRQFMKEFCEDDFKIITGNDEDSLRVYTMEEILPEGFRL
ncbi:MAG: cytidine deaminase [Anaerovoracaceae bacterium]